MKVAVFGLGNFGHALAVKLTRMGHEVLAVDREMGEVEAIKSEVSFAVCLASDDPNAMKALPLHDVDVAVVAIGEDEGANIMTTALLVNLKVRRVVSRAINPLHEMVLNSMGVTDIVHPEEKAAESLARRRFVGRPLDQVEELKRRQLGLVTVLRKEAERSFIGRRAVKLGSLGVVQSDFVPEKGDILVLFGTKDEVAKFTGVND
jgi:trk system potassium uptake protein TrkA